MLAVLLALTASGAWGASDLLGAVSTRRLPLPQVLVGSQLAGGVAVIAPAALAAGRLPPTGHLLLGAAAGAVTVGELGLIYFVLARGPMVVMAPIAALGALLPVCVGLATGERLTPMIAAGVLCCLAGAGGVSWPAGAARPPRNRVLLSAAIGVGAAVCTGTVLTLIGLASKGDPWWTVAAVRAGGGITALSMLAVVLVRHRASGSRPTPTLRSLGAKWRRVGWGPVLTVAGVGLTDAAADAAYAHATARGALAIVSVIASLYPVTTIALGAVVLGDRPRRAQLIAAAVALSGVAALAAATSQ